MMYISMGEVKLYFFKKLATSHYQAKVANEGKKGHPLVVLATDTPK